MATKAPAFTLSSSSEKVWANDPAKGFTVNSTGGPAIFEIYPEAPVGMNFNPNTGAFSGTPVVAQPPTAYVVIGVNSKTKATRIFTLEVVNPLALVVTQASNGITNKVAFKSQPQISLTNKGVSDQANGTVVTATVSQGATLIGSTFATAYAGVAIFSNLGISGTIGTSYTITYSAASGYAPISEVVTPVRYSLGDTGPAGGIVFYSSPTSFACGPILAQQCNYLEVASLTGQFAWADQSAKLLDNSVLMNFTLQPSSAIGGGCRNTWWIDTVALSRGADSVLTYKGKSYSVEESFDTWCIPSTGEMSELMKQQNLVGGLDRIQPYWTSTWNSRTTTAEVYFPSASMHLAMPVTETNLLRPVRAF
jgi:hypothetical protein